ncbi:hypothetical protein T02_8306 [Trichinella nativa]|uniref:Uncharacterized protein n=1 Tax=Trichinella nativa TaxID=6335 RepID=A0A0V1KZI9_9BILA|nr:hypothetical protein T02_8306 [Trichinella nativa]
MTRACRFSEPFENLAIPWAQSFPYLSLCRPVKQQRHKKFTLHCSSCRFSAFNNSPTFWRLLSISLRRPTCFTSGLSARNDAFQNVAAHCTFRKALHYKLNVMRNAYYYEVESQSQFPENPSIATSPVKVAS